MGFHWPENFNTVPLLEKVRRRDNEEQNRKEVLDVVVSFLARVVRRRYHATLFTVMEWVRYGLWRRYHATLDRCILN